MSENLMNHEVEYLRSILDSIFDEIMILDKEYTILDVNVTFCAKYGILKEAAIGKKCYKLTHGLNSICKPPECKCPVEDVLKTGKSSESIHCHQMNGDQMYVELLAYPIKTKDGKIKQIVKIGRDITERKSFEQEIKESKEKLNFILSSCNDSVIVVSKGLEILYMNNKAEEVFGENQIGKICHNVLMNNQKICDDCSFRKLRTNYNTEYRFEREYVDPYATEKRFFEFSCTPILNFNGQPAIIDIVRDITDRKNAEIFLKDSEEKFRKLCENFPFSLFLIEPNTKIYDCNSIAELYLNKSKEELIDRNFFDLFTTSKENLNSLEEMIYNIANFNLSDIMEFKFINYTGHKAWVELFFSPVKLGNTTFIQVILQDITERKLVEKIIKKENKKLKELDEIKKQLMRQASEKLKTPLNNIFDLTEIFLKSYKDQLDKNAIKLLELIRNGGEKSLDMVGRILNISEIESYKFELHKQTESLIEIIIEAIDDFDDKIKNQNIIMSLNFSDDFYSEVDKIKIKQVIKDLLLKALKSISSNNKIEISLIENNNHAEILINFIGFGLKKKKPQFELNFSKEIVNLHGGQVIVKSGKKKNRVQFIIQLPIKNWKDSLIHLYIIYRSGIPLYDYSFIKNTKFDDPTLISGGLVGMMSILKAIIHGKKQIKTIDHGDRKLMFERNSSKDIIFVLLVKEDLKVFRKKLNILIENFDKEFQDLVKNIESTSSFSNNWENIEPLIKKLFDKQLVTI